uniref:Serine-threonine/tyrosine-protein kinase catalytic domain-containing protein n=1 Tax=Setaria italica TaxID=4555 RepID=K3YVG9_SETIT
MVLLTWTLNLKIYYSMTIWYRKLQISVCRDSLAKTNIELSREVMKGHCKLAKTTPSAWGFMAPEYANQGLISKKADIFSLGVIILEVVTHHPRFPAVRGGNADVRVLAPASRSWPTTTFLKMAKGVVIMIRVHLILILLNPSSSRSRMILTTIRAVITAAETLVAVGVVTAFLTLNWLKYFRNLWPWVILVFGIGVPATVLDGVEEKLALGSLCLFGYVCTAGCCSYCGR